jgi:hypothetical protein
MTTDAVTQVQGGFDATLCYNSGSYSTPTWVVLDNIRNVKMPLAKVSFDSTTRRSKNWKTKNGRTKDVSISFEMLNAKVINGTTVTYEANVAALWTAWKSNSPIEVMSVDGPLNESGHEGVRFMAMVEKMDRDEKNEGEIFFSVVLVPTFSANAPAYVVTTGT